jgi:hypothetical protein
MADGAPGAAASDIVEEPEPAPAEGDVVDAWLESGAEREPHPHTRPHTTSLMARPASRKSRRLPKSTTPPGQVDEERTLSMIRIVLI